MKKIAVLTSGGDAPGMNAAIRSVVRSAVDRGWEAYGVMRGFAGLIDGNLKRLGSRDVSGIIQHGGTMLGSARCEEFKTEAGQRKAMRALNQNEIDALIVIGGNGSQQGAHALYKLDFPVVGIASTIDNDLYGSDVTLGVDTALNIALESIDRLKTTASSHNRAILVEIMGRDCGYLALMAAIAGGAETVVIPEVEQTPKQVVEVIQNAYEKGKAHALVVVAEGAKYDASKLEAYFKKHEDTLGFKVRATILGHVQRGGNPGAFDRILGSRFGAAAVEQVAMENYGVLVGYINGQIATTPLPVVVSTKKELDLELFKLADILD